MGKRPNKARSLTEEEEEVLWEAEKFGSKTPEALISSMWWLLTQFFGLRGRQEHHAMKMEDFQLCKNDEGMEFVQFTEGPTKTRKGGLQSKNRIGNAESENQTYILLEDHVRKDDRT